MDNRQVNFLKNSFKRFKRRDDFRSFFRNITAIPVTSLLLVSISSCHVPDNPNKKIGGDAVTSSNRNTKSDGAVVTAEEFAVNNAPDTIVYKSKVRIDSSINIYGQPVRIHIETDFDSSVVINIPQKYLSVWGLKNYQVFKSFTRVSIFLRSRKLIDSTIRKERFLHELDSSEAAYGNLLFPMICVKNDTIDVQHSLSIPTTDIGQLVSTKFFISGIR